MNEGDRLHGSGDAGVAGSKPTEVGGEAGKDVQVAFLKSPVGEGGYGHYSNGQLRRALEWQGKQWYDHQTESYFPPPPPPAC